MDLAYCPSWLAVYEVLLERVVKEAIDPVIGARPFMTDYCTSYRLGSPSDSVSS